MADDLQLIPNPPPMPPLMVRPGPVPPDVVAAANQLQAACANWGRVPADSPSAWKQVASSSQATLHCDFIARQDASVMSIFYAGCAAGLILALVVWAASELVKGGMRRKADERSQRSGLFSDRRKPCND